VDEINVRHPLAKKQSLSLSDLKDLPLISLPIASRTRRLIDGAASSLGFSLKHVVTVSQFATMLGCVRARVGLAIAPKRGVTSFLGKELSAVPVRGRPLPRELGIITLKEREPSPAASGLMSLIKASYTATR